MIHEVQIEVEKLDTERIQSRYRTRSAVGMHAPMGEWGELSQVICVVTTHQAAEAQARAQLVGINSQSRIEVIYKGFQP